LLDGGVTDGGLPYLVMEYVEGTSIDRYCDEHRLPVRDRLRLFCRICDAVQYAHRNLVVHRDLKPSNILVTDDGRVRLLDFGISKLLDPEGTGAAEATRSLLLMTPEHAAPEQFLGMPIATATDVYQLGVLLYALLAGRRSSQSSRTGERSRARVDHHAAPPSTSSVPRPLAPAADESVTAAEAALAPARATSPDGLRRQPRGYLDRILLMALRNEPER